MARFITETGVLTSLSRMMGKRVLPTNGSNDDWKEYCQTAFDYAWRYYRWDWSMRTVTVDLDLDPYLPEDFDIGGYREALPDANGTIAEVDLKDFYRLPSGLRNFALEFDPDTNTYKVLTNSGISEMVFVYQVEPPLLNDDPGVVFPSSLTIGIGAAIYAKQGENPQRANIDQEWDQFHAELDRHVGRSSWNIPRSTNLNLQDSYGTYTGDSRA